MSYLQEEGDSACESILDLSGITKLDICIKKHSTVQLQEI